VSTEDDRRRDNGQDRPMPRRRLESLEVIALIALNFGVFFYERSLRPIARVRVGERYGAVPVVMWDAWHELREAGLRREVLVAALPLLTANFLHADFAHIGGNMLFLWVFANVVQQTVGRALMLVIYLIAGLLAVLVHVHANPTSEVPMVGASGAIAGLEGAYFTFVFRWDVPHATVWPIESPLPAASLAFLAVANFALDTGAFVGHSREGVAYGAHVGGFLGGALVAMVIASVWAPKGRAR
jgi:membrane associated rhomboid family serine protease